MIQTNHYSTTRFRIKGAVGTLPGLANDLWRNRRCQQSDQRILITRHCAKHASMFRDCWAWINDNVPELASRVEFHHLPYDLPTAAPNRYAAHVVWINDTLDLWSPSGYTQACRLLSQCRDQGIECVNPIDRIANVGKARGAELMRKVGVRTPIAVSLLGKASVTPEDLSAAGIGFPCLIREERGHGRPSQFIHSADELAQVNLSKFLQPIAVEFIDTRDPQDGLFRKYRYVSAGDVGIPRHLITDPHWDVRPHRRVKTGNVLAEEAAYIETPDPNHEILTAARKELGMDVVGFDYSFTPDGELVIWEANPYLDMNHPKHVVHDHLSSSVTRTFAAVAHLYLRSAGVKVPDRVIEALGDVATFDFKDEPSLCNR